MIMLLVSMVLDVVMAGLLIATIVFARRLSRQIVELREGRGALEALIRDFSEATEQADSSVAGMRRAAADSGESLHQMIKRGQTLKEEMEQIVQSADALANRLEHAAGQARGGQGQGQGMAQGRPMGQGMATTASRPQPESRPAPPALDRAPRPSRDEGRSIAPPARPVARPDAAPLDRSRDVAASGASPRRAAAEIAGSGGLAARLVEAAVAASRPAASSDGSRDPGLDATPARVERRPHQAAPARPSGAVRPPLDTAPGLDSGPAGDGAAAPEARSRAERDLLQALENMRQ